MCPCFLSERRFANPIWRAKCLSSFLSHGPTNRNLTNVKQTQHQMKTFRSVVLPSGDFQACLFTRPCLVRYNVYFRWNLFPSPVALHKEALSNMSKSLRIKDFEKYQTPVRPGFSWVFFEIKFNRVFAMNLPPLAFLLLCLHCGPPKQIFLLRPWSQDKICGTSGL